jgi:hypothetical protein
MQLLTQCGSLVVSHDSEIQTNVAHTRKGTKSSVHPLLNLVAQGATSDGERNGQRNDAAIDDNITHHSEIDDRAMQFGVVHWSQRINHAACGDFTHDATVRLIV